MTDNVEYLFGKPVEVTQTADCIYGNEDCKICPPAKPNLRELRYPAISELRPCGICGGLPIAVTKANDLQCMACGAVSQTHEVKETE